MKRLLITYSFICAVFLNAALSATSNSNDKFKPSYIPSVDRTLQDIFQQLPHPQQPPASLPSKPQLNTLAVSSGTTPKQATTLNTPLAAKLAGDSVKPAAISTPTDALEKDPTLSGNAENASDTHKVQQFYSEKKSHSLSASQLAKFNNLYLEALPNNTDVLSPVIKRVMAQHAALFDANYRVQSPMTWSGEVLAGWGMLPHSGGSSRVQFFIHRNGKTLVIATIEDEQFYFGAASLLKNAFVAQEIKLSNLSVK